jgi:hypothetical protein
MIESHGKTIGYYTKKQIKIIFPKQSSKTMQRGANFFVTNPWY